MQQAEEPTVEEILGSIKKVIARDNRTEAAEERRRQENTGIAFEHDDADDDILDLAEGDELIEEPGTDEASGSALVNESVQANMRESFAALSMLSEPGAQPQIVRSGETSLEGMVRDLLRPALAEWLDKNLPPLVERIVAAEIKRIAGKKG
jgi:cell pole-organizing protein PopZ